MKVHIRKEKFIQRVVILPCMFLTLISCTTAGQYSRTKEGFKEATGQTLTSWSERKETFIRKSENRIDDIAIDLTRMKNELLKLNERQKVDAISNIKNSRALVGKTRTRLNELKLTSAENWQGEKANFLTAMDVLDSRFEKTRNYFN